MNSKEYAAFLSFADPDRDLVTCMFELLREVGLEAYFAPKNLPKSGSQPWKDAILQAIRNSACFVPILTRNSLHRPWVLYESGAADVTGIPHLPAKTGGTSYADVQSIPGPDVFIYDLSQLESLTNLVLTIYEKMRGRTSREENEQLVRNRIMNSETAKNLMAKAAIRWVFIAGSVPQDEKYLNQMTIEGRPDVKGVAVLEEIVADVTQALLDAGFYIASCSEVPSVGSIVARQVTRWMCDKGPADIERYRIAGLYPIDRQTRERDLTQHERDQWRTLFMEFRKSYLKDKEWLLVLGGNEGCNEEVLAAQDQSVALCTIPAIGGTGRGAWEAQPPALRSGLQPLDSCWSTKLREILVAHLKGGAPTAL